MNPVLMLLIPFALVASIVVGVVLIVWFVVPLFKGLAWLVTHVAKFVWGMLSDALRFVGALVLSIIYIPLILGSIIIARWSATAHFGRALQSELGTAGVCLYRVVFGHLARLFMLNGLTEGIERRLPAVLAAAPTADEPRRSHGKSGKFEGYSIIGSLPSGGSGAKLYIAEPDEFKAASLARAGHDVERVVIKSFSLAEGSSLPQIVRESRSLEAARRLGLILDHDLQPDRFHYVMRYIPGDSLTLVTRQLHATSVDGGLGDGQLRTALGYSADLVRTLAIYHRGGLWHKDVKPDNIIVDSRGDRRAHLVDFGLVSSLGSAMTLTTHGTEYFRDPVMVQRALQGAKVHEVDGTKFDIYGAGAVLFAMVEDTFPPHGALSQVSKRCPEAVKWIIRRAMAAYDNRYASADEMLRDLEFVLAAKDPHAIRPFELPSVRAGNQSEGHDAPREPIHVAAARSVGGAAAAAAGAVGAAAVAAGQGVGHRVGRYVPSLRVTNWWSGASVVDQPAGGQQPSSSYWSRGIKNAVDSTTNAARAAMIAARRAAPPYEVPPPPAPEVARAPLPKRSAAEQLAHAKARAHAARTRATTRINDRRQAMNTQKRSGGGVGIAVALLVFAGLCSVVIVGTVMRASQVDVSRSVVISGSTPVVVAGPGAPSADVISAADSADTSKPTTTRPRNARPSSNARTAPAPAVSTPIAPAAQQAGPPAPIGTLLVISDLRPPLSPETRDALETFGQSLMATPLRVWGEGTLPGLMHAEQDIEAVASLRLAIGRATPDASGVSALVGQWLSQQEGKFTGVLWITPAQDNASQASPLRTHLFYTVEEPGNQQSGSTNDLKAAYEKAARALTPARRVR
jgi:hypothetical protein